jgi:hypothetical protein
MAVQRALGKRSRHGSILSLRDLITADKLHLNAVAVSIKDSVAKHVKSPSQQKELESQRP